MGTVTVVKLQMFGDSPPAHSRSVAWSAWLVGNVSLVVGVYVWAVFHLLVIESSVALGGGISTVTIGAGGGGGGGGSTIVGINKPVATPMPDSPVQSFLMM